MSKKDNKNIIKHILREETFSKLEKYVIRYLDSTYQLYIPQYFRQFEDKKWGVKKWDGTGGVTPTEIIRHIREVFDLSHEDVTRWVGRWFSMWVDSLSDEEREEAELNEDLEYSYVSDASPESDEYELGVELNEDIPIHKDISHLKGMYERLRRYYKDTPEYIVKEFFINNIANVESNIEEIRKRYNGDPIPYIGNYWDEFLRGPWRLRVIDVNPMDFDDTTVDAFIERDFGDVDAYQVPDDQERMERQKRIAKSDGMNEPIIVVKNEKGKYVLIEGWHRTMSILLLGNNDEDLINWDKVKIRAFVLDA